MLDEVELKRLYLLWRFGVPLQRHHPNGPAWYDLREACTADTYDYFKNKLVWGWGADCAIRIKPVDQS